MSSFTHRLQGKRILVLGANDASCKFVKKGMDLGAFIIVTDNIPNSTAKGIASDHFDIDGKDVEKLYIEAMKYNVEGIILGAADPLTGAYVRLAQKLGLPCFINDDNIGFFTNKTKFKTECKKAGIDVIEDYYVGDSLDELEKNNVIFPCIVKPQIGRGGKGVCLCKTDKDLERAFDVAKRCSDNGNVIIEKYYDCKDIISHYFICDGIPHLIATSDRITLSCPGKISPVTYGNHYPSVLNSEYLRKCDNKIKNVIRGLGIKDGFLEIQSFFDGVRFIPYDPCCVLGGEFASPIYEKVFNIDLIAHYFNYAVTGDMDCEEFPSEDAIIPNNMVAESVWILLKPGVISRIDGQDDVDKIDGVVGKLQCLREGDCVPDKYFGTEKSCLMRIWIVAETEKELKSRVNLVREKVIVFDSNGNNMIWNGDHI